MRVCINCGNNIPCKKKIDGKTKNISRRKYCLDCSPFGQHNTRVLKGEDKRRTRKTSEKVVSWRRRTKMRAVNLKGGKCSKCGYAKSLAALVFHHRDPNEKEFSFAGIAKKWDAIEKELAKCDLLCMNCHAELHEELRQMCS